MTIYLIFTCFAYSSNARLAAVGSLIILMTLRPAIVPAAFVASLCELLKYAGTVITASLTSIPRYTSA
jgi:hypothetical protein